MSLRNNRNLLRNEYIRNLYAPETPAQKHIRGSIEANNLPRINLDSPEAKIVQILIKLGAIRTIVEFGTHAGYSAASMAASLPEDGKIYTFEKDPRTAEIAKNNFKQFNLDKKIEIIVGDAHEVLRTKEPENLRTSFSDSQVLKLLSSPIDMVFIDAEKKGYPDYLEWSYTNLRKGGIIIADNTFLFEAVYDPAIAEQENVNLLEAMQKFNHMLSDSTKFESIILPTDEGLSVAIKL